MASVAIAAGIAEANASPSVILRESVMARRTEDGELENIYPQDTIWHLLYVNNPMKDDESFQRKFRLRFRLPYASYEELKDDCCMQDIFSRWMGCDATGKMSSPIELLILGSLRGRNMSYLIGGRDWAIRRRGDLCV